MVGYPLDGPLLEVLLPILAKKNFPLAFGRETTTHFSEAKFPLAFGRPTTPKSEKSKYLIFGHFFRKK